MNDTAPQYAPVRDTTLAWSEEGAGPTVVWAHPLLSDAAGFERAGLLDWGPVPASGRRLLRYDARGHGRSGGGTDPAEYRFENLARDLLALLDARAPGRSVSGIGLSLGTATLLHAAVIAPERFDRLVLAAPPTAWATRPAQGAAYAQMAELIEREGVAAVAALLAEAPTVPAHRGAPGLPLPVAVDERRLPAVLRGVGASDLPSPEAVAGLRMPVLVLPWTDDPAHPVSTAHELARLIPGAAVDAADTREQMLRWGERAAAFLAD